MKKSKGGAREESQKDSPLTVETWPIEKVSPYKNNPRINDKAVSAVARSISKFGFRQPIVVDKKGIIIAGHTRYRAALEIGLKEVPVHIANISDEKAKAYRIADNKTGEISKWDEEKLFLELKSIDIEEVEIEDIGFTEDEVETLNPFVNGKTKVSKIQSVERVGIETLQPNPHKYKSHPQDQIDHLKKSIRENGIFKNVIISQDDFILDGHAVIEAAKALGIKQIPVTRLNVKADSPEAMKITIADNEIQRVSEVDDRLLVQNLKRIKDHSKNGLVGTGYDEMKVANLLYITRPASEIGDIDEAKEWVGMTDYENAPEVYGFNVHFKTEKARADFLKKTGLIATQINGKKMSGWWPPRGKRKMKDKKVHAEV